MLFFKSLFLSGAAFTQSCPGDQFPNPPFVSPERRGFAGHLKFVDTEEKDLDPEEEPRDRMANPLWVTQVREPISRFLSE